MFLHALYMVINYETHSEVNTFRDFFSEMDTEKGYEYYTSLMNKLVGRKCKNIVCFIKGVDHSDFF